MIERILIADDEATLRENLKLFLEREGYSVATAADGAEALEQVAGEDFALVLSDIRMPEIDGLELLRRVRAQSPDTHLMLMTAFATVETAVEALREGAADYLIKPVRFEEILTKVANFFRYRALLVENRAMRQQLQQRHDFSNIIGQSQAMQAVFRLVEKITPTRSSVLITGASGTGKELIAGALHYSGPRKDARFVAINCSAIPENLMESELFGHVKGSFTGAVANKEGLFRTAHKGTLFLDEIGEMPYPLQAKLLRAIESEQVMPVGATTPVHTDTRIVAATNKDLAAEVEAGRFRQDLYYRLNVVEVAVPPLRERREDIPALVEHFVRQLNRELKKNIKGATSAGMRALTNYEWKGNVRELENAIERAMIYAEGDFIDLSDLPPPIAGVAPSSDESLDLKTAVARFEREHIGRVLAEYGGDKRLAARKLGIGLSSLYRKLEEPVVATG